MTRRVFLLMGLAILAVVLSHAAGWGQIAMFLWTDRYRPVEVPNYDQLGTLPYYVLLLIRQLTVWSVPAFLFASGFFVAYAARGSQSALGWKMVKVRISNLLIPYFLWSVMCFVGDWLDGVTYVPVEYLEHLVLGRAVGPYFYVPLLCQFYLLSPLIAPVARIRRGLLLLLSALVQLGALSLQYLILFGSVIPGLYLAGVSSAWLPIWWAFYFASGIVCGFHMEQFKGWLAQHRRGILVAVIVLGLLAILEPEVIYRTTGREWRFVPLTITTSLYSLSFVLCFLAFDKVTIPFSDVVHQIGRQRNSRLLPI